MTSLEARLTSPEALLKQVGNFGFFQKRTLIIVYFVALLSPPIVMISSVFISYTPPHRCYIPDLDDDNSSLKIQSSLPVIPSDYETNFSNLSSDEEVTRLARYVPVEIGSDGSPRWSQCYRYKNKRQEDSLSNQSLIPCDLGWKYDADPGLSSAGIEFDLVCGRAWMGPFSASMVVVGYMIGNIFGGYVSDRWGRRFAYLTSCFVAIASLVIIAVLPLWEASFPLWCLSGCAFVCIVTSGVVMINEMTPTRHRYAASFIRMLAAAFSYMLVSCLNYFVKNWRFYLALQAACITVSVIPAIFFLKESFKWLLQNKKYKAATLLLKEIARVNKKKFETNLKLLSDEQSDSTEEEQAKEQKYFETHTRMTYVDLFRIAFLRKRVLILAMAWIAVTTNYYGLSINTNNLGGSRYVACFISGAVEIPGDFLCYFGLKKFGGRIAFMGMIGISGLFLTVTPLLFKVHQTAVIVSNMIGKLFATGAFAVLYIFLGDFFPTLLRIQAYGVTSFPSRLTSMLVPYLMYIGDRYVKAVPYLVMGSAAIAAAVGMCFLPETRKMPLPDTVEDARRQEISAAPYLPCCKKVEKEDVNDNIVFK